jgi:hypothetical protein
MHHIGHLENQVLVGRDGYLFLAGGAHNVLKMVSGSKTVSDASKTAFAYNIKFRSDWSAHANTNFLHIIFPDKQSIIPHAWPLSEPKQLGSEFASDTDDAEANVVYPTKLLQRFSELAISRVDTHLTAAGAILIAGYLASRILHSDQMETALALVDVVTLKEEVSGDLGSKFDPPLLATESVCRQQGPGTFLSNNLKGGNNGIIDLRINQTAIHKKRLLIFGDSFARQFSRYLAYWFSEVVFLRTPFFHPDIADLYRPDFLITENSERYLDTIKSDNERPFFFSFPHLRGVPYDPPAAFAEGLSALLSFPRMPYKHFMTKQAVAEI